MRGGGKYITILRFRAWRTLATPRATSDFASLFPSVVVVVFVVVWTSVETPTLATAKTLLCVSVLLRFGLLSVLCFACVSKCGRNTDTSVRFNFLRLSRDEKWRSHLARIGHFYSNTILDESFFFWRIQQFSSGHLRIWMTQMVVAFRISKFTWPSFWALWKIPRFYIPYMYMFILLHICSYLHPFYKVH